MTMFVERPRSHSPRVVLFRIRLEIEVLLWRLTR